MEPDHADAAAAAAISSHVPSVPIHTSLPTSTSTSRYQVPGIRYPAGTKALHPCLPPFCTQSFNPSIDSTTIHAPTHPLTPKEKPEPEPEPEHALDALAALFYLSLSLSLFLFLFHEPIHSPSYRLSHIRSQVGSGSDAPQREEKAWLHVRLAAVGSSSGGGGGVDVRVGWLAGWLAGWLEKAKEMVDGMGGMAGRGKRMRARSGTVQLRLILLGGVYGR
ncbi:hypothetical protein IWX92DRAFT_61910 [Phyllosticta citricarpa]